MKSNRDRNVIEQKKTVRARDFFFLYITIMIYSIGSVFAKKAAAQTELIKIALYVGLEIFVLMVYALAWQQVLKRFQLAVAVANKGITVIFSMVWAVLVFKESITLWNVIGASMIFLGVYIVSLNE